MRTITIEVNIVGDDLEHNNCKVEECNLQFNLHEVCEVFNAATRNICHYWSHEGDWEHPVFDANGNRVGWLRSTTS
jgi:hypothetical protein